MPEAVIGEWCVQQVKRVVIIGTSVIFFGTTLTMKTKLGTSSLS